MFVSRTYITEFFDDNNEIKHSQIPRFNKAATQLHKVGEKYDKYLPPGKKSDIYLQIEFLKKKYKMKLIDKNKANPDRLLRSLLISDRELEKK